MAAEGAWGRGLLEGGEDVRNWREEAHLRRVAFLLIKKA